MGKEEKLTGVAMEAGYYDQPHFIRAYRKFTGTIPSSLKN
jgi:AraC-like DNA-binding protein